MITSFQTFFGTSLLAKYVLPLTFKPKRRDGEKKKKTSPYRNLVCYSLLP